MKVAWILAVLALPLSAHAAVDPQAPQGIGATEIHAETFGAKGDGTTDDTAALQQAIDATAAAHGTLVLRPGTYLTGSLFLKSGMALRLDKDVHLTGAQTIDAYPKRPTRIAGIEMSWPSALINIYRQSDVKIYGEGTVDGNGKVFWDVYRDKVKDYVPKGLRWAADYDAERPRLIQVYDSARVELGGGLNLRRSGFWTVQLVYDHDVKVSDVTIRNNIDGKGPSTDGIDIDSSHDILVENADIDVNDDALCLKAGRDADGLRVNRPTEHVLIRNSTIRAGAAGVTFGSETSGTIHDVEAYGLHVIGPAGSGVLIKSAATRGGGVSDIYLHDITVDNARTAIAIDLNWNPAYSYAKLPDGAGNYPDYWKVLTTPVTHDQGLPHVRNVRIDNLKATTQTAITINAYPEAPAENISLDHIDITAAKAGTIDHAKGIHFTDASLHIADGSTVKVEDATDVTGLP